MAFAAADPFIAAVDRRLERVLAPEPRGVVEGRSDVLADASRHLCVGNGAKRLRPRLVLLLGEAAGASLQALEDAAVTAELMHSASLLHDDVVDEGTLRRGRPTVNAAWSNSVAVLAGDWMLSRAFTLLAPHPREVTTEAIEVLAAMSRSAVAEIEARGRSDLPIEEWRAIAEGKTGRLFAWCGRAAARLGERQDLVERFDHFGLRLGVAFQLADDLKDLWGGEPGKNRFADLKNRNPSLPILLACRRSTGLRQRVAAAWARPDRSQTEVEELGAALIASGAEAEVTEALGREIAAAVDALGELRESAWCEEILKLAASFARGAGIGEAA